MQKATFFFCLSLLLASCFSTQNIPKPYSYLHPQVDSLQQMGAYWQTIGPWNDDDFDQIDSMLMTFPKMLGKVLGNPQIVHYRLDTLAFFNTESEDGRLACFTWEEKMGGTYRPGISLLWYLMPGGSIGVEYLESDIFPNEIYAIQAKNGETLYVLYGSGKGCSSCVFAEFFLFRLTDMGLESIFEEYAEFRTTEDSRFDYDVEKQELDISYYDLSCTDSAQDFHDSCKVETQYFFNGETFIVKE